VGGAPSTISNPSPTTKHQEQRSNGLPRGCRASGGLEMEALAGECDDKTPYIYTTSSVCGERDLLIGALPRIGSVHIIHNPLSIESECHV